MFKRLLLLVVVFSFISTTLLNAQKDGFLDAVAVRMTGANHLFPLSDVDDFSVDDFRLGMEFEFFSELNDYFDVSFPLRLSSVTYAPTGDPDVRTRQDFHLGLNALLNLNLYKGKVFRPRIFAGVGTALIEDDQFVLDAPIGLGLDFRFAPGVDFSTTFAYHYQGVDFRDHIQIGAGFRVSLEAPEPSDRDEDGIPDTEDLCPDTPGIAPLNGCPDSDGDGITDANDKCPDTAGLVAFEGCPDTDGDGLKDSEDKCPVEAGPVDNDGCPIKDRDGDGVNDEVDACPDVVGTIANSGCPAKTLVINAKDYISNENIPGVQVNLLDGVGNVLKSGITDAQGQIQFTNIDPGNYSVTGKILDVDLKDAQLVTGDFNAGDAVQKTIYYDDPGFLVQGKVFYCNSDRPLPNVALKLRDKRSNFVKSTVSDAQGQYSFSLKNTSAFELYAQKESFLSQVIDITPTDYNRNTSVFVRLEVCAEEVECGKDVRLNNILYDTGSSSVRVDALPDLNRVVQFLRDNKDATIELSSHTDSRGSASSNQSLSERRASKVVEYIIAQGIDSSRVKSAGYGESRLVNECADGVRCTDEQHQQNRRTVFKVICPE